LTVTESDQDYAIFGLSDGASAEEIRHEYRRLAMAWHPDRLRRIDPELRLQATQYMQRINAAYARLTSPRTQAPILRHPTRYASSVATSRGPRSRPIRTRRVRRRAGSRSGPLQPVLFIVMTLAILALIVLAPEEEGLQGHRIHDLELNRGQSQWHPPCSGGLPCGRTRAPFDRVLEDDMDAS
jgi:hypothetical protein